MLTFSGEAEAKVMTTERHETFPNFLWKRLSYDDKHRRFLTYECSRCHAFITNDDANLELSLSEHESFCDPKRADASA
jgi:hypothetical protein